jgi:hypothetical protein
MNIVRSFFNGFSYGGISLKLKKLVIMLPLIIFLLGFSYSIVYTENSDRVISAIDFNNEDYNPTSFKYRDLSNEARKHISKEEFTKWNNWDDLEKSFTKFNNPKSDANFVTHGQYRVVYSFYQKSIFGYKLSYIEFDR